MAAHANFSAEQEYRYRVALEGESLKVMPDLFKISTGHVVVGVCSMKAVTC
jgi:hypothetical protein